MRVRHLFCSSLIVAVIGTSLAAFTSQGGAQPAPAPVGTPVAPVDTGVEGDGTADVDVIDRTGLETALADARLDLPEGSSVYAVRLEETGDGLAYEAYEAGEGALADDFWPASSVKLLAAVGALEYLADLGFTGAARITMGGETFTVADVYEAAIADSSNEAYDMLVQIAGVDWLNTQFLTAENGFAATVIQRSYTGLGVDVSPAMAIVEGSRRSTVPTRRSTGTYACPDEGNCSNLLEMTDSVRRVVLNGEIPDGEQFDLTDADVAALTDALLDSEGFVEPAVEDVLGEDARVYNKPGYVPGDECVDVALVDGGDARYLVGVVTPEDGSLCPTLVDATAATLEFLETASG